MGAFAVQIAVKSSVYIPGATKVQNTTAEMGCGGEPAGMGDGEDYYWVDINYNEDVLRAANLYNDGGYAPGVELGYYEGYKLHLMAGTRGGYQDFNTGVHEGERKPDAQDTTGGDALYTTVNSPRFVESVKVTIYYYTIG